MTRKGLMMASYQLICVNDSDQDWTFYAYQTSTSGLPDGAQSVAWFVKRLDSGSQCYYTWTPQYDLTWSEVGTLVAGAVFEASQTVSVDPSAANALNFTYADEAFTFAPGTPPQPFVQTPSGALYIDQDGTIPNGIASIGIGMSGSATFAVPAEAGTQAAFSPQPVYHVAVANSMVQGQVIDPDAKDPSKVIAFPTNMVAAKATLGSDKRWTVIYSPVPWQVDG